MKKSCLCASTLLLSLSLLSACVEKPSQPEEVQAHQQSIINGSLDTSRQAVIAIAGRSSLCSGTIVKTDPGRGLGWVLTAAHCVTDNPEVILQGNDYTEADRQYTVVDYVAHPAYSGRDTTYDFAVILISGISSNTPVIPIVGNNDGLSTGSSVTSVGYGRTTPSDQADNGNSRRRRIGLSINGNTNSELLVYGLQNGGICQGDSGGPVLAVVNGTERVAGVHSSVTGECEGQGFSGRVTSALGWIQGQLDGDVEDTCDLCRQVAYSADGDCAYAINNCFDDQQCAALSECFNNCNSENCQRTCVDRYPGAIDTYYGIFDCLCEEACTQQCEGEPACPEGPSCGIAFADETCNTCQENSCCNEALNCSEDSTCGGCLNGQSSSEECNDNANFIDYYTCLSNDCADPCGIEVAECGFTAEGACGTCLEGSCCAETADCADDAQCNDCLSGTGDNCENNALFNDAIDCLASCNGDPCGFGDEPGNNSNPNNINPNNINPNNTGNNSNPNNGPNNNTGNNSSPNNDTGNNLGPNNVSVPSNNDSPNNEDGFIDGGGGSDYSGCATTNPARPLPFYATFALGLMALVGLRRKR